MNTSLEELNNLNLQTDDRVLPLKEIAEKKKYRGDRYTTGFNIFDNAMMGGFKNGDLAIISGISGGGKTSLAQTLTYNMAKQSIPTLWFSYEVGEYFLHKKFKEMGIEDFYYVYHPEKNTTGKLDWIKIKIKEGWAKYNTKVIFIDHIDFLTPNNIKNSDNQAIAFKQIAIELKSLAIELDVAIILLAHLRKTDEGKEPGMQDIGYSAGVFQLADYVFMIWRENQVRDTSQSYGDLASNKSIIKIVKNRETGQLKYIKTQYEKSRFVQETIYEIPTEKLDF